MMPPTTLATLPVELLEEISVYLDKKSLKSLRLAGAGTNIVTGAFTALFRSFALRLRVPDHSLERIENILQFCDSIDSETVYIDDRPITNPLRATRTLTIDTSRPNTYSQRQCRDRYDEVLHNSPVPRRTTDSENGRLLDVDLMRFRTSFPQPDFVLFFETLQKVVTVCRNIKNIKWYTSNRFQNPRHKAVSSILCGPASQSRLTLDVVLALDLNFLSANPQAVRELTSEYIGELHGLSSLKLRTPKHHKIAKLDLERILSDLGSRCKPHSAPMLEMLDYVRQSLPGISDKLLWDNADRALETLEMTILELQGSGDDKWTKVKNGNALTVSCNRWRYEFNSAPRNYIFRFLETSEIWVKKLKLNIYSDDIQAYLLATESSFLTDIEIDLSKGNMPGFKMGTAFWAFVIPRHAATLKSIRVFVSEQGDWCFTPEGVDPVSKAISQCKELEELGVCFIHSEDNYLQDLIQCVITHCPKFYLLEMGFCDGIGYRYKCISMMMKDAMEILDTWESRDEIYRGRVLEVRKKIAFEDVWFEERMRPDKIFRTPPVWYDYWLQTWRLFEKVGGDGAKSYGFRRDYDEHIYYDMLDERRIEGPLTYKY